MPSNDVKIPSKTIIPEQTAGIELEAPTSMTDFIQIAPVSHDITANNFDSRSAPHHPLVSTVEPKPSEAVPLANAATTKESRRTSTSERVLSFFASFLKPPEATAAETDLTAQSEIRQDERDEVKTSAEVVHKNYTEDTHTETSKNIW